MLFNSAAIIHDGKIVSIQDKTLLPNYEIFFEDRYFEPARKREVVEVAGLQKLMRYVCKNGFAHHAAMSGSNVAPVLAEAFENYMGWTVYHHEG